jgi:hypothetical protein
MGKDSGHAAKFLENDCDSKYKRIREIIVTNVGLEGITATDSAVSSIIDGT